MPANSKPSATGTSRRSPVLSQAAIAEKRRLYEQKLAKRIRIAAWLGVVQGILCGLYAALAKGSGVPSPWIMGGIAALSFAAAAGVFRKIRMAGVVLVAFEVVNLGGLIWMKSWGGIMIPIVFLLLYIDGMRALFAWSRWRATVPASEPDIEALQ
jgi:hypothetical protein